MKQWLFSIGILIILVGALGVVLPDKRLGKTIKAVFSLLIFLLALKPVSALKSADFDFEYVFNVNDSDLQEDFVFYIAEKRATECEKTVSEYLIEVGVENADILAEYSISDSFEILIKKININLSTAVINSDKEHIDILDEAREKIIAAYGTQTEVVFYE